MRTLVLCLLLTLPLTASELKVGDDAPPFKAGGDLINPPEFARTFDDCKGDVLLVMEWCIGDATTRKLPEIQRRWDQFGEYGLMVFAVHRLEHNKLPQVRAYCRSEKITFPVAMGGMYDERNEFGKYSGAEGFWATIIGVDGKVAFFGKDDFLPALDKELARIAYPKLGKHTVAREAERAAKKLLSRDFGSALNDADKLLATELPDEAKADLELLKERLIGLAEARNKRAEEWKENSRWDLVSAHLERMQKEYKGHALGDESKAELARIKKDKALKKELEAFTALKRQNDRIESQPTQARINALRAFARAHPGLGAAAAAEEQAKILEAELS